jgi:minor extracellular protease Epr
MESYRYANRGSYVDVSAPGVEIWTALPDAKEGYRTGTSFAVPFVTAILAARKDRLPIGRVTKQDVVNMLPMRDLGPPGPDPIYGRGLAMAPKACGGSGGAVAQGKLDTMPQQMSVGAISRTSP